MYLYLRAPVGEKLLYRSHCSLTSNLHISYRINKIFWWFPPILWATLNHSQLVKQANSFQICLSPGKWWHLRLCYEKQWTSWGGTYVFNRTIKATSSSSGTTFFVIAAIYTRLECFHSVLWKKWTACVFFVNSILLHKLHLRFMCVCFQQGNVYNITTSLQNSVISCVFTTTNTISIEGTSGFNQSYYLLFSYGPSNNGNIIWCVRWFVTPNKSVF